MTSHFLASYVDLLIATCHRRGVHAMGGMAAQIPIKNNPEANSAALNRVRDDKLREVWAGHDGTWVAHPGLVPAGETHLRHLHAVPQPAGPADVHDCRPPRICCRTPEGPITEAGLAINLDVGLQYLAAWLGGNGCVPIYNLMEDAATAEICRAQVWQWLRHGASLDDGRVVTPSLVREAMKRQVTRLRTELPESRLETAAALYEEMIFDTDLAEFLTLRAYDHLS